MEERKKEEDHMPNFKMMEINNFSVFSNQNINNTSSSTILDDVVASSFPVPPPCETSFYMGLADMPGFIQDYYLGLGGPNNYSLFDLLQVQPISTGPGPGLGVGPSPLHPDPSPTSSTHPGESSEVVNTPATPNSVSVSSSSSEAPIDDHNHHQPPPPPSQKSKEDRNQEEEHDDHDDKSNKQ